MVRALAMLLAIGSGAPAAADPPQAAIVTHSIGGVTVLETTTGGAKLTDRAPLIIALHPQGGDPADFVALFRGVQGRAHLVLPSAEAQLSWYRDESTDPGAPGVRAAAARLARVWSRFVDPKLVIGKPLVVGYSQGAIVALTLAVSDPPRIAAVVSISGRLPPALFAAVSKRAARPVVDELHGELDATVPYAAAQRSIRALAAAGWTARLHSYAGVGHAMDPDEATDAIAIIDAFLAVAASP